MSELSPTTEPVDVLVMLPFAYRDGMDRYEGVMRYLREKGIRWNLQIVREVPDARRFKRYLTASVKGVICGSASFTRMSQYVESLRACRDACQSRNIPLVGLDWSPNAFRSGSLRRCSVLNIDSEKIGAFAAQAYLNEAPYATYAFVGKQLPFLWSRDRGAFFVRTLRKAGCRNIRIFDGKVKQGLTALEHFLRGLRKPAAVFAANDYVADLVLKSCARIGARVSEDIAVLGVDDDPVFCVHTRPTLSSIHPDFEEMGYRAAEELNRLMRGRVAGRRIVVSGTPVLTARMSTAPCSAAGSLVRRADEIIAARGCQDIDSNVIADALKISRRLLDLRYRQLTGMTVREAIVRTRLRYAKHLLAYSGHTIGTISRLCGYRTASYLARVFLAHEGVSMESYRLGKKDIA